MSNTVLVTGATGFIGSTLCRELTAAGWEVRGLHRMSSSVPADLDIEWIAGDVLDPEDCQRAVIGCDYVVHLAGLGLDKAPPDTVWEVNVEGTRNIVEASLDADIERLVFASTAGTRRATGVACEHDLAPPIGTYQQSKSRAEELVHDALDDGLDAVVVHPTSVFGPGDGTFTAQLCTVADRLLFPLYLPGGVSVVSVDDVAGGIHSAIVDGETGEHYILGGENLTYKEILSVIAEAINGHAPQLQIPPSVVQTMGYVAAGLDRYADHRMFPYTPGMAQLATKRLFCSSRKAQIDLGYEYRPLDEYVGTVAEWYETEYKD